MGVAEVVVELLQSNLSKIRNQMMVVVVEEEQVLMAGCYCIHHNHQTAMEALVMLLTAMVHLKLK